MQHYIFIVKVKYVYDTIDIKWYSAYNDNVL